VLEIMISIQLWEYLVLLVAVLAIIPTYVLLKLYIKTRIVDYLLLGFVYSFSIGSPFFLFLAKLELSPEINVFISKNVAIGFLLLFLSLFIYGSHIKWDRIPRWYLSIFLLSFAILSSLILLASSIPQPVSTNTLVGVLTLDQNETNGFNAFFPDGFLLELNGITIIASSYPYLVFIYGFIVQGLTVGIYLTVKISPTEKRLKRVGV